jgi:hypothetical protein
MQETTASKLSEEIFIKCMESVDYCCSKRLSERPSFLSRVCICVVCVSVKFVHIITCSVAAAVRTYCQNILYVWFVVSGHCLFAAHILAFARKD